MPAPRTIIQLTRALLYNQHGRRTVMFYTSLGSALMVFIGAVLMDHKLREHPVVFLIWWAICAWLMLASALLAVFDLLMIRVAARQARRDLARKILNHEPPEDGSHKE